MLPLRDHLPTRTFPFVNYLFIVANIAAFVLERTTIASGVSPDALLDTWGLVPRLLMRDPVTGVETIFSSMFLHDPTNLMHIGGNMLYLWIFGDNVEEVLGHVRYLLVYLACGLAASVAHIALAPDSLIPSLGASGAIAGVMGMYLIWFPQNQVRVLVLRTITWMPALLVIGLWIVMQLVLGMGELSTAGQRGGVAYAAHVGGAVAGVVFAVVYRDRARALEERPSDLGWAPAHRRFPYTPGPYR